MEIPNCTNPYDLPSNEKSKRFYQWFFDIIFKFDDAISIRYVEIFQG